MARVVPRQQCAPVTRQACGYAPRQQCEAVARQQCRPVTRQHCAALPQQQCAGHTLIFLVKYQIFLQRCPGSIATMCRSSIARPCRGSSVPRCLARLASPYLGKSAEVSNLDIIFFRLTNIFASCGPAAVH